MNYKVTQKEVRSIAQAMIRQLGIYHEVHCMSQSDIALAIGISVSQISRIATGVCTPSACTLWSIFRLYCSSEMLIKRRDYHLPLIKF